MPGRNIIKIFAINNYYHVYNRGVAKQVIFHDDEDYRVFLNLIKRYLDIETHTDKYGRPYEQLRDQVELLAYCLMPNHFHLLCYLNDEQAITRLLRNISCAYTTYYNKKYNRVGTLFQGRYKASRITSDDYLLHISRYIHLNPKDYKQWAYSSLPAYLGKIQTAWLQPTRIMELFKGGPDEYEQFIENNKPNKDILEDLKYELADR